MRRRASLLALVALVALFLVPSPVSASPGNAASDEARFVSLVNAERAKQGVAPLQVDSQLTALARDWAAHQLGGGCGAGKNICHANSLSAGVSADWLKLGENVGTGPNVDAIMDGFVKSSGHYRNLMDPAFTRIGVGVVWSADGTRVTTTHRFMEVAGSRATPERQAPVGKPAPSRVPAPTTTTTAPPPPVAAPSRVSVVLHALQAAAL